MAWAGEPIAHDTTSVNYESTEWVATKKKKKKQTKQDDSDFDGSVT
jgi:hypothetical protein